MKEKEKEKQSESDEKSFYIPYDTKTDGAESQVRGPIHQLSCVITMWQTDSCCWISLQADVCVCHSEGKGWSEVKKEIE